MLGDYKSYSPKRHSLCFSSSHGNSLSTHQKFFCKGIGGGLLIPKKLPLLLGKDKDDKEPLAAFLEIVALGRVYGLWASKPPP